MKTLYDLLGARPDDDAGSLKEAYRKAAKANHPDHHAGDPEAVARFTRIVRAYDILRDENRRAAYDQMLGCQRTPLLSKAGRATSHPAHRFAFHAIIGVVVGIVLAGGGYLFAHIYGMAGDGAGAVTAGQPPRMVAVEPAKRTDTAKRDAASQRPVGMQQIPVTQGAAASAGKGAWEAAQDPSASDAARQTTGRSAPSIDPTGPKETVGEPGRDRGDDPPEVPQSAVPRTVATAQEEEICKRDAAQLAHLRISQAPDEVIRFERELGCEKLRPQVIRLRESVDPNR